MRLRSLLLAAALLLPSLPAGALPPNWQPMFNGYQQLTSLSAATGLTVPASTVEAFIVCTGQTVMWRDDGTNPTATVGMPLLVNQPFPYIANLAQIKLIETTPSAKCNVSYYK